jgi:hypothetical protein
VGLLSHRRIESAHSTWLFDTEQMRFARLPRGIDPSSVGLDSEWRDYFGLEIETSGAFTVALNREHTKLLRAWREDPEPTTELELLPDDVSAE